MDYRTVSAAEAYGLLNSGGIILICTRSASGAYDIAPVAWNCPLDYEPTSRVLFVLDPGHLSRENIDAAKEFAIALPGRRQKELVEKTGSVSGRKADKYEKFGIEAFAAKKVDARVPEGVAGWLECRLLKTVAVDNALIVMGEVVHAEAVEDTWKERLYYAGEDFFQAGERI